MSYEERIELVRQSLIAYCKECIRDNYNESFVDIWLIFYAGIAFGYC